MLFKKLISALLIITFVLGTIVPQSHSSEICFTEQSAKTLEYDLEVCDIIKRDYSFIQIENNTLNLLIEKQDIKISLIEKDKAEFKRQSIEFKQQFLQKDEAYQKAIESKPSKVTWFSVGGLTSLALIVLGLLVIK